MLIFEFPARRNGGGYRNRELSKEDREEHYNTLGREKGEHLRTQAKCAHSHGLFQ